MFSSDAAKPRVGFALGAPHAERRGFKVQQPDLAWKEVRSFAAGDMLPAQEGPEGLASVLSGWAYETLFTEAGHRQIVSFRLPGDMVVRGPLRATRLVALTQLELTPTVGGGRGAEASDAAALAVVLARQSQWLRDQILRLGALDAHQRTAHLLLEFHDRLFEVGLVKAGVFRAPLTQELFGEALGLSAVHVNRTLKRLRNAGLVSLRGGAVTLNDLPGLRKICSSALAS